jgi:hypothetical protein
LSQPPVVLPPADRVNVDVFNEARVLFAQLRPETYCRFSNRILASPTPEDRLAATADLHRVAGSGGIYAFAPLAVIASRLYYLVTACEGMLMPALQCLVALAGEKGHRGPPSGPTGTYDAYQRAKKNFGDAISFLGSVIASDLRPLAPATVEKLDHFFSERLSHIRNAVAHFNFKFDVVEHTFDEGVSAARLPLAVKGIGQVALVEIAKFLGLDESQRWVDYAASSLRYELPEKPITSSSPSVGFSKLRALISDVDMTSFGLIFGFLAAGADLQASAKIRLAKCGNCGAWVSDSSQGARVRCPCCKREGNWVT